MCNTPSQHLRFNPLQTVLLLCPSSPKGVLLSLSLKGGLRDGCEAPCPGKQGVLTYPIAEVVDLNLLENG